MVSNFDDLFDTAAAPALDEEFGVDVLLIRGSLQSAATFTASFAKVMDQAETDDPSMEVIGERRQWWLPVASVLLGGSAARPRAGDVIQVGSAGSERHEIMPHGSDPAVEDLPGGSHYLVRTKRVAE